MMEVVMFNPMQNYYAQNANNYAQRLNNMVNQYGIDPMQQAATQQNQQTNIIWVQGDAGAKAYQMASNSKIILMDSEDGKFYLKQTDENGMASVQSFIFEIAETEEQPVEMFPTSENFVTREEFENLKKELTNAEPANELNAKPAAKPATSSRRKPVADASAVQGVRQG